MADPSQSSPVIPEILLSGPGTDEVTGNNQSQPSSVIPEIRVMDPGSDKITEVPDPDEITEAPDHLQILSKAFLRPPTSSVEADRTSLRTTHTTASTSGRSIRSGQSGRVIGKLSINPVPMSPEAARLIAKELITGGLSQFIDLDHNEPRGHTKHPARIELVGDVVGSVQKNVLEFPAKAVLETAKFTGKVGLGIFRWLQRKRSEASQPEPSLSEADDANVQAHLEGVFAKLDEAVGVNGWGAIGREIGDVGSEPPSANDARNRARNALREQPDLASLAERATESWMYTIPKLIVHTPLSPRNVARELARVGASHHFPGGDLEAGRMPAHLSADRAEELADEIEAQGSAVSRVMRASADGLRRVSPAYNRTPIAQTEASDILASGKMLPCKRPFKVAFMKPGGTGASITIGTTPSRLSMASADDQMQYGTTLPATFESPDPNFRVYAAALRLDPTRIKELAPDGAVILVDVRGKDFEEKVFKPLVQGLTVRQVQDKNNKPVLVNEAPLWPFAESVLTTAKTDLGNRGKGLYDDLAAADTYRITTYQPKVTVRNDDGMQHSKAKTPISEIFRILSDHCHESIPSFTLRKIDEGGYGLVPQGASAATTFDEIFSDNGLFKDVRRLPNALDSAFDLQQQRLTDYFTECRKSSSPACTRMHVQLAILEIMKDFYVQKAKVAKAIGESSEGAIIGSLLEFGVDKRFHAPEGGPGTVMKSDNNWLNNLVATGPDAIENANGRRAAKKTELDGKGISSTDPLYKKELGKATKTGIIGAALGGIVNIGPILPMSMQNSTTATRQTATIPWAAGSALSLPIDHAQSLTRVMYAVNEQASPDKMDIVQRPAGVDPEKWTYHGSVSELMARLGPRSNAQAFGAAPFTLPLLWTPEYFKKTLRTGLQPAIFGVAPGVETIEASLFMALNSYQFGKAARQAELNIYTAGARDTDRDQDIEPVDHQRNIERSFTGYAAPKIMAPVMGYMTDWSQSGSRGKIDYGNSSESVAQSSPSTPVRRPSASRRRSADLARVMEMGIDRGPYPTRSGSSVPLPPPGEVITRPSTAVTRERGKGTRTFPGFNAISSRAR